jgi:serine/threonine protein kinase
MIDNKFKILKDIGRGCSSRVFLVEDYYHNVAAVKAIRNDKGYDDKIAASLLQREHALLNKMKHHPNIINSYYTKLNGEICYDNKIENIMYNVTEYAENGSIAPFIMYTGGIEENICRFFMNQICNAIKFIHDQGYAHLDIKLENILLDKYYNIKVADMGCSVNVVKTQGASTHRRGTYFYMPPEVQGLQRGKKYNAFAADIYTLGVTLFVMLIGEFPLKGDFTNDFTTIDTEMTTNTIQFANPDQEFKKRWGMLSDSVKSLIQKMIDTNPDNRPTILEVLQHPWLSKKISSELMQETFREMEWRKLYMKKNYNLALD